MKSPLAFAILTVAGSLFLTAAGYSASLSGGSATIDYDKTAWDTLASGFGVGPNVLTLDEYFDQAASNSRTSLQVLNDEVQLFPSYTGQIYAMNGASVSNLSGRTTQPTDFAFTLGSPQTHTGSIGLGGVAQFEASGGGHVLYGDFTLLYDATRIGLGGTGWYLKGNIPPAAAAYDILNVSVVETPGFLTISGDLGVSFEVANFLYNTPSDAGKDTFTGQVVPEPSACLMMLTGLASVAGLRRRRATVG